MMSSSVRTLTVLTWLLVLTAIPAQAAPIVTFNFADFNAAADQFAPHVTSTDFTAGTGLTSASFASGAANARGWHPSSAAAGALADFNYWEFTITADAGYQFDVDTLSLNEWRGSKGPGAFQLYSGGTLIGSLLTTNTSSASHVIPAPATDLASVVVRLLAWNATNNGTTADWSVDDIVLNGNVEPVVLNGRVEPVALEEVHLLVPEPASVALLGIGLSIAAALRRLKGRA